LEINNPDGLFVASMAGFLPLTLLAEMTNIGTLFAFVIVCGAVLVMRKTNPDAKRPFRAPLVPLVRYWGIVTCLLLMFSLPVENWWRLIGWLIIGLIIYFLYGRKHSVMAQQRETEHELAAMASQVRLSGTHTLRRAVRGARRFNDTIVGFAHCAKKPGAT